MRVISNVMAEKRGQAFDTLDTDGDGYLRRADFAVIADRLAAGAGVTDDAPVRHAYLGFWNTLARHLRLSDDGRISRGQYIAAVHELVSSSPDGFDEVISYMPKAIIALYDADGDGRLDHREFLAMEAALGVDPAGARISLLALDRDADGFVVGADLLQAAREFVVSNDPHASGNWLFGGLKPPPPRRF